MHQSWLKLLFMHWPLAPGEVRPYVPKQLDIDTFNGSAWIGITPFAVRNMRPVFLPPFPWLNDFHEINVRTYVHYRGTPGVWFFSLDADSILAVVGARMAYHLPYRQAQIRMRQESGTIRYSSHRRDLPPADFHAVWRPGEMMGKAPPESLDFFLAERYCLYAESRGRLFRARIFHEPWNLQRAELAEYSSTMLDAHGFKLAPAPPLLHYSETQQVTVWPPEAVSFP